MLWWDGQVLDYIEQYGADAFKKLYIWGVNWIDKALLWGKPNVDIYRDPRSIFDKYIQFWLMKTQKFHQRKIITKVDKLIKSFFQY